MHLDGQPVQSWQTLVSAAAGKKITPIEGVGASKTRCAVQAAWIKIAVPQCGYCQSGQIMSACALLAPLKSSDGSALVLGFARHSGSSTQDHA